MAHDEFFVEFQHWSDSVQDGLLIQTARLKAFGPFAGRPTVDTLKGSSFGHMKELRFEADGGVWRVAFAFDPERKAILLCGASKTGKPRDRFYEQLIRTAERRYKGHLARLDRRRGQK